MFYISFVTFCLWLPYPCLHVAISWIPIHYLFGYRFYSHYKSVDLPGRSKHSLLAHLVCFSSALCSPTFCWSFGTLFSDGFPSPRCLPPVRIGPVPRHFCCAYLFWFAFCSCCTTWISFRQYTSYWVGVSGNLPGPIFAISAAFSRIFLSLTSDACPIFPPSVWKTMPKRGIHLVTISEIIPSFWPQIFRFRPRTSGPCTSSLYHLFGLPSGFFSADFSSFCNPPSVEYFICYSCSFPIFSVLTSLLHVWYFYTLRSIHVPLPSDLLPPFFRPFFGLLYIFQFMSQFCYSFKSLVFRCFFFLLFFQ